MSRPSPTAGHEPLPAVIYTPEESLMAAQEILRAADLRIGPDVVVIRYVLGRMMPVVGVGHCRRRFAPYTLEELSRLLQTKVTVFRPGGAEIVGRPLPQLLLRDVRDCLLADPKYAPPGFDASDGLPWGYGPSATIGHGGFSPAHREMESRVVWVDGFDPVTQPYVRVICVRGVTPAFRRGPLDTRGKRPLKRDPDKGVVVGWTEGDDVFPRAARRVFVVYPRDRGPYDPARRGYPCEAIATVTVEAGDPGVDATAYFCGHSEQPAPATAAPETPQAGEPLCRQHPAPPSRSST